MARVGVSSSEGRVLVRQEGFFLYSLSPLSAPTLVPWDKVSLFSLFTLLYFLHRNDPLTLRL